MLLDQEDDDGVASIIPMEQQVSGETQASKYYLNADLESIKQLIGKSMPVNSEITAPTKFGNALRLEDGRTIHLARLMKRSKPVIYLSRLM